MIQSKDELEKWYSQSDPWGYFDNPADRMRKARIISSIPPYDYENVLDIGCGNGFITNDLPGQAIVGLDVSDKAIGWANQHAAPNVKYMAGSLFDLVDLAVPPMDLIVITGVLYQQYLASSHRLVYVLIDNLLKPGGILLCSHISDWYKLRFPYLTVSREHFAYREYYQVLEVYCK